MAEVFAPYQELHEQTYHKCLELKDSPVWKKSKEESGATFYTASAEGSSFSMVKSETLIKAPMQAVIDRLANTPKIDENTPDAERDGTRERWLAKTVDDETRATFLYIALISSSRFVTDRDFLMYRRCYKNGEMHVQLSVSVVNDEIKPEV